MEWPKFNTSETAMDQLVKLSQYYGSDPEMVIAGGGNTSCKVDDILFVKGSGSALATITPLGFVEMDRNALDRLLEADLSSDRMERESQFKSYVMAARNYPAKGQRPSVEAVLHNLMPRKYVVHTHSTMVNMFTCALNGESLLRTALGNTFIWIGDVDPGFQLARVLFEAMEKFTKETGLDCPRAVIMQNHGLVTSGNTPDEVKADTDWLMNAIGPIIKNGATKPAFGTPIPTDIAEARKQINIIGPALRGLLGSLEKLKIVRFDDAPEVMELVCGTEGQVTIQGGALSPDQIVYCKSFPLWFDPIAGEAPGDTVSRLRTAIETHIKATRFSPLVVLVKGLGLFGIGDDVKGAQISVSVYKDAIKVMAGARRLGGIRYLKADFRAFIEDWEVESYRKSVSAAKGPAGRVAGKIAIITGAAQGFGLEISQHFVSEGGLAVLTDMNAEGARSAAEQLCLKQGSSLDVSPTLGLPVNVTDLASIDEMIHQVVRSFGGFDVFISNAGVVKAGSVKTQSEKDFDFVANVNYKGFFLCTQKAAQIMAIQHMAQPGYLTDIVQINSKSGLVGSNKNGAYAGSKFGGIGLVQSFAMELIEDGIKVNAVCPGNFFDGPLWSDPKTGLFVQYLQSGKVPGAKTILDVKKFYEAKVPMGRGTTTPDVMKAIFYLIDQKYETGQAVPVSGGQVMLK
jgi:rhamnose utilization protein RhaD (predicted bifunctional aldolase and dehydrogenase)/NAD(P)-dependent dehydrogenase (short-subunit alcohol dehydrogenase family)